MKDKLELSNCELLLINRLRSGLTQEQAADALDMTRNQYGLLERNETACVNGKFQFVSKEDILPLNDGEHCLILRRREDKTQEECADEMGITRFWFNQMEQGKAPSQPLIEHWGVTTDDRT